MDIIIIILSSALSAFILHTIIRTAVVAGIKQSFKEMEEAKLPVRENTEPQPIRTNNKLVTKSGIVFERKTEPN